MWFLQQWDYMLVLMILSLVLSVVVCFGYIFRHAIYYILSGEAETRRVVKDIMDDVKHNQV